MVQGIFDDLNPETRDLWAYPDTGVWDPNRNTAEFVASMEDWYEHGLLAFSLNLQGGSPVGYSGSDLINSAFREDGSLYPAFFRRLERILDRADEIGMVVILGLFYFGQDQHLEDEAAVLQAVDNTIDWLFNRGYRNVLIEVNNECTVSRYDHPILGSRRVHELIERIRNKQDHGYRFLVGTSYGGGYIPRPNVVQVSDFLLIHGNGVHDPHRITEMVEETRQVDGYRPMPIVINEDDHYNFNEPFNNFVAAVQSYASWGYFDYRREGEAFEEGYQSVPVDWRISSDRKRSFFGLLRQITGR